jgi:hypothetical protein
VAKRRSYFWASDLHFPAGSPEFRRLSPRAREGLEYARGFARNAVARREAGLSGDVTPVRLTPADLGATAIEVNVAIKQTRIELFGKDLSDSAIAYRLKQRRDREPRTCADPGCRTPIPSSAHGRTRFCRRHGSGKARVARHRARVRDAAGAMDP